MNKSTAINQKTTPSQASAIMADYTMRAQACLGALAKAPHRLRQDGLVKTAALLRQNSAAILAENAKDISAATASGVKDAFIKRLSLNDTGITALASGLEDIADLPDPLGQELERRERPNGLVISKVSTPLGVLGVIYESRPNVTIDAGGLAVKSGNPVILRCGSDSINTSLMLAKLMRQGLEAAGLPEDAVQVVANTDRMLVGAMLAAVDGIDVIIPRGGKSLVERVRKEARVPVFAHLDGICHLYIDKSADLEKARAIAVNAKMRRVEICGALETLLIDAAIAEKALPAIATALRESGCALRADAASHGIISDATSATEADWATEYLDSILSIAVVDGVDGAIEHISRYGSHHTDSIVTEDEAVAEKFLAEIDSAIVMVNASTQFADGGEFGMGAEIGISTGRLHARGPIGANQLTSNKYLVKGSGQTRP